MVTPDDSSADSSDALFVDPVQMLAAITHEPVVIPRSLLVAVGDPAAAVALVALIGWSADPDSVSVVDRDGSMWVIPTDANWWEKVRLEGSTLTGALTSLKTKGLIEVRSLGLKNEVAGPENLTDGADVADDDRRVPHYRLIMSSINAALSNTIGFQDPTSQPTKRSGNKRPAGPVTLASLGYNPHSDDQERLETCLRLAQTLALFVAANGGKEPAVTKTWVEDFDRMTRIDGYTLEQIENALLWSQSDDFWWKNIRSPQKLRKHFEMLREQARREPQKAKQQITKSRAVLVGDAAGQGGGRRDVFADQSVSSDELSASEEEHLAKSWGMVWSETEKRWVQPRPELPEYLNDIDA